MQIKQTQSSFPAEAPDTQKLGSSNFWVPFPAQPSTLTFSLSSHDVKNAWFKSPEKAEKPPPHLLWIPTPQQNWTQEKRISLQKPPWVIPSGRSYLSLLRENRGSPLPQWHLRHAVWFNINLLLGPQLKATAGKQNEIQQKPQLLGKGIWHNMEKAAKMKWL